MYARQRSDPDDRRRPRHGTAEGPVREVCSRYDECLKLRDPETAPDKWTRDAVALRNLTVLQGSCPHCGATIDIEDGDPYIAIVAHDGDCPANELNMAAHLSEHELTLDNMGALIYGIRPDRCSKRTPATATMTATTRQANTSSTPATGTTPSRRHHHGT
jgi:hypothetical protein